MKKQAISILILLLISTASWANGVTLARGDITELYFDTNGDWTIEMSLTHVNNLYDTVLVFYSKTDSSCLSYYPTEAGIFLITESDLISPFNIDPNGDYLHIGSFGDYSPPNMVSEHRFAFGNHPYSHVNAAYQGQSLVGITDGLFESFVVKDNIQSLGYHRDPDRGILKAYVYDSLMNPLPYQQVYIYDINIQSIWTDENGYFEYNNAYGNNNQVHIQGSSGPLATVIATVEPDSTTEVEMILPINNSITVTGRIVDQNMNWVPGSYAIFTSECPDGPIDSFPTNTDGYYSADLVCGDYYVRWSGENHIPEFMPWAKTFYYDEELGGRILAEGKVNEIDRENKSRVWNNDFPYYIFGNQDIEHGDTLIINPGCEIYFCGYYNFEVYGTLMAIGNEEDSIYFQNHSLIYISSYGISLYGTEASGSKISYCRIKWAKQFNISNGSPLIEHNSFIWVSEINILDYSAAVFQYNKIKSRVHCRNQSQAIFNKNYHTYNGGECVILYDSCSPTFSYNTFNTFWVAFMNYSENSTISLRGNIFSDGENLFWSWAQNIIPDNIDYNLFYDIYTFNIPSMPEFGVLNTSNANGDTCDIYSNLFMDPLFVKPDSSDYHLLYESPCIDAGDPASSFDPDNTVADIGAFYFDQLGIYVKDPSQTEQQYELVAIPNPNNGNFSMVIISPQEHQHEAKLQIHALNGSEVPPVDIAMLRKGKNTIDFKSINSKKLNSGIYICTLIINSRIQARTKIIIE